jgi:hypothetical protein
LFYLLNRKQKLLYQSKSRNQSYRLIGGGVATSPGSSRKTGSLPRRDCSPDTPFVAGKASLTVSFTDLAASFT